LLSIIVIYVRLNDKKDWLLGCSIFKIFRLKVGCRLIF
jgi:hypothetical protein